MGLLGARFNEGNDRLLLMGGVHRSSGGFFYSFTIKNQDLSRQLILLRGLNFQFLQKKISDTCHTRLFFFYLKKGIHMTLNKNVSTLFCLQFARFFFLEQFKSLASIV